MAGHTPLPWEVDIRLGCLGIWRKGESPNCHAGAEDSAIVYQTGRNEERQGGNGYRYLTKEQEANFKLIVKAVNLHPKLVEVLAVCAGLREEATIARGWLCRDDARCGKCLPCTARALIAEAEKGGE